MKIFSDKAQKLIGRETYRNLLWFFFKGDAALLDAAKKGILAKVRFLSQSTISYFVVFKTLSTVLFYLYSWDIIIDLLGCEAG